MDECLLKSELKHFIGVWRKPMANLDGTLTVGVRHRVVKHEVQPDCLARWEKEGVPEGVIESFLDADILAALCLAKRWIRNFKHLSEPRQRACVNLAIHGEGHPVRGFRSLKKAFDAIQACQWVLAGQEVQKSKWAVHCANPSRAEHIAKLLLLDD